MVTLVSLISLWNRLSQAGEQSTHDFNKFTFNNIVYAFAMSGLNTGAKLAPKGQPRQDRKSTERYKNIIQIDGLPGADAGAKIAACIAALPFAGGTCDARNLEGSQTIGAMTISLPVTILIGVAEFSVTRTILIQNVTGFQLVGVGAGVSGSQGSLFTWAGNGADPMFKLDDVSRSTFKDFRITANTGTPLAAAFHSENGAGSSIAPGGRLFENLFIQGTNGGITKGFRWVGTGAGGDANNEADIWRNVRVAN